jgi:hypothetical protein
MRENFKKVFHKHERGQAIVLIAAVMIGVVAMVGLVADTGLLLIEYGKLKRGVDAAAVAAAQQYSLPSSELTQQSFVDAATNFLNLNQTNGFASIEVHSCLPADTDPPELCNKFPITKPEDNRKLVEVTATETVNFGFLSVVGIKSTTISASAVGEAATMDIVLVLDTSASMAYETRDGGDDFRYDADSGGAVSENPEVCNLSSTNPCLPMDGVKQAALSFIDTLNFGYDRAGVVALTGQETDGSAQRYPVQVLPLSSTKGTVQAAINGLKVFQPHRCDPSLTTFDDFDPDPGVCIYMSGSSFQGVGCQSVQVLFSTGSYNWAPCPSSNIGGALRIAAATLSGTDRRLDAYWVVLVLMSGPANATDTPTNYPDTLYADGIPASFPYGYCPASTYYPAGGFTGDVYQFKPCTDGYPSARHAFDSVLPSFTYNGNTTYNVSNYDPDDYARDRADNLANLLSGTGVTIYTIGLGKEVQKTSGVVATGEPAMAEDLLKYIAEEAGRSTVNHGQYFYAPTYSQLLEIFEAIAENIATKISQ